MLSIENNFEKIQTRNPNLGAFTCLAKKIKNRRFSRKNLVKSFKKLVPNNDYLKDEQKGLDTLWGFDKIREKRNEVFEATEAGSAKYERNHQY